MQDVPQQAINMDLLENVSEWIMVLSPEGLLLEINQRPLTDAQVQRAEVVGTPFTEFPVWSSTPAVQEQLHTAIAYANKGDTVRFEVRVYPPAGHHLDLAMTLAPHRDESQQIRLLICTAHDITRLKQAEEERYTLVGALPHFIWVARPDGYVVYGNQSLCDYLAMPTTKIEGNDWIAHVHPDDRQQVWDTWQASIQAGTPYETEYRLCNGNSGAYRWFLIRATPQRDAQGVIQSWIGTFTDINDQKQATERIKDSEQNFRVLAETMPQLVWTLQSDGRLDYANQRCCDYAQTDFEHLRGYGWRRFVHPDDLKRRWAPKHHSPETGGLYEGQYRIRDGRTGEYRWFLTRAIAIYDKAGRTIKRIGTATDIDGQKQIEEALRRSQKQVQTLMASNIIGIGISEGEQIIEANDTFLRMTGYSRQDLQQHRLNWMQMTAPEYLTITRQAHEQMDLYEYMAPYEKEYIGKDGSHLAVVVGSAMTQRDPHQSIFFVLDNSASKALEQRRDTFISMASHELRTPLTALKMRMQLLKKRMEKQEQQQNVTALSKIEEPIQQLERLIGELLDVSKMRSGKVEYTLEPVDLALLAQDVAATVQQIHKTHTIVVGIAQPLIVMGDKGRLEQVLANLLSNAIKYSPSENAVEMFLSSTTETAVIKVRDHGIGIPQEQQEKIFERFYRITGSKQETVPGLGMGLYIVGEIVKQHQGSIKVESTLGEGSIFEITLPLKKET